MILKPFFSYYGSKWRLASKYPAPKHSVIIEPFAGSAGYSTRYFDRNIVLCDVNEKICGVWDYLINVSEDELIKLPIDFNHVDEISCPQEAKWLIGFWLGRARYVPGKTYSKWNEDPHTSNWKTTGKKRCIEQVKHIRHWKVFCKSYEECENIEATWFIDPPYDNAAGKMYACKFNDYNNLAEWSKQRNGQVIVCENEGATWMNFKYLSDSKSCVRITGEVYWTNKE